MATDIYLFNVERGQCIAIKDNSSKWYIFDIGCSDSFSPISWIIEKEGEGVDIEQLTLSHYHGDHLGEIDKIYRLNVSSLYHVGHDDIYLTDCYESNSNESGSLIRKTIRYISDFEAPFRLFYGGGELEVSHQCLTMQETREIGGSTNTKVNNSSIVSRINVAGLSILICGDIENSGWDYIFNKNWLYRGDWDSLIENVDVLIAPHHGHSSGFSVKLMQSAYPSIVLASVASKNPHVDSRYSMPDFVKGWNLGCETRRLLTTRNEGHIKITVTERFFQKPKITVTKGVAALS